MCIRKMTYKVGLLPELQYYVVRWNLPELLADDLVALAILLVVLTFSFASLTSKSNHGNSNSLRMEKYKQLTTV